MLYRSILSTSALLVQWCFLWAIPTIAQDAYSVPIEIFSDGATLQARFYSTECETTCPTLLLIPGWDSREHLEKYTAWQTERGDIDKFGELLTAAPSIRYFEEVEAWESVGLLP